MRDRVLDYYRVLVKWLERLLALVVLGGSAVYAIGNVPASTGHLRDGAVQ